MTFNLQMYTCSDRLDPTPQSPGRNGSGMVWEAVTNPFATEMTLIFSFLNRSGWSAQPGPIGGLFGIGTQNELIPNLWMYTEDLPMRLKFEVYDNDGGFVRYDIELGDEDGVNWLKDDKIYQIAIGITPIKITAVVNGSTSPKKIINTNSPGALALGAGLERVWVLGPNPTTNRATVDMNIHGSEYPSVIAGISAFHNVGLDFDNAAARNRIFDQDGNFKNPGETGSLWFSDVYGAVIPSWFFVNGSPQIDNGSAGTVFTASDGGFSGSSIGPGGSRKQYEGVPGIHADWIYLTFPAAEASGDPWQDGDTIDISNQTQWKYYTALDVNGHSGLIHRYRFNDLDEISSLTLRNSEGPDTDPDGWTGWTDLSTGVKGVDYDFDVPDNSRLHKIQIGGTARLDDTNLFTADVEGFMIIRDATAVVTAGDSVAFFFNVYTDASNWKRYELFADQATGNWFTRGLAGSDNSTLDFTVKTDIWIYLKNGKGAVWFNDQVTPALRAGSNQAGLLANIIFNLVGDAAQAGAAEFKLKSILHGGMTT